jgi:3-oxoadipate enol-lactonase
MTFDISWHKVAPKGKDAAMQIDVFEDGTGLQIAYSLAGPVDAPVIVFSNALGTNMSIWHDVRAALGAGFQTLIYDQRGQGASGNIMDDWGMSDHVSDLIHLIGHLGLGSVTLCGLSIGGQIAQGVAAERPDLVSGLILVATSTKSGFPDHWEIRASAVETGGMEAILQSVLERWCDRAILRDPQAIAPVQEMVLANDPVGYARSCRALGHTDLFDSTARLAVPAMAIAGAGDQVTPPDILRELSEIMVNCEFQIIRGAGHLVPVDKPTELTEVIAGFMARLPVEPTRSIPNLR